MNIQSFDLLSLASSWFTGPSTPKYDDFDNGDYDGDFVDYDDDAPLKRNLSSCLPGFSGLNSPSAISTSGKSSKLLVSSIDLTLIINFFVNRRLEEEFQICF